MSNPHIFNANSHFSCQISICISSYWKRGRFLLAHLTHVAVCFVENLSVSISKQTESTLTPWALLKCLEKFGSCCVGKKNLPLWAVYSNRGHCFVSSGPAALFFPICLIPRKALCAGWTLSSVWWRTIKILKRYVCSIKYFQKIYGKLSVYVEDKLLKLSIY